MFGYFSTGNYFSTLTDVDVKNMLFNQQMKAIEDDVLPFGFVDDGTEYVEEQERQDPWATKKWVEEWGTPW